MFPDRAEYGGKINLHEGFRGGGLSGSLRLSRTGRSDGIVRVYLNYVAYCRELGVEFMAGYYDTKNQALNPAIRTERPYPIVTVQAYVEQAAKDGIINIRESIDEFTTDIRMIVIGNVFEWCLREGNDDFEGNMSRSLRRYLDSTLEEG